MPDFESIRLIAYAGLVVVLLGPIIDVFRGADNLGSFLFVF